MYTVCITECHPAAVGRLEASVRMDGYFACGEDTHTLRLTSELVDLQVGYAKRIR